MLSSCHPPTASYLKKRQTAAKGTLHFPHNLNLSHIPINTDVQQEMNQRISLASAGIQFNLRSRLVGLEGMKQTENANAFSERRHVSSFFLSSSE